MSIRASYVLWLAQSGGEALAAADWVLETDARGRYQRSALRYRSSYLQSEQATALHPVHAPLTSEVLRWDSPSIPAIIDDVLPGYWERRVLARLREARGDHRDADDLHALFASERQWSPGALNILPNGQAPATPSLGYPLSKIGAVLTTADEVDENLASEAYALERLRAGSSLGGARPKLLVESDGAGWVAKWSRATDSFDYAAVEHACLKLAAVAGLNVAESRLLEVNGRNVVLIKRFDVNAGLNFARNPLHSVNGLLKDRMQADLPLPGYDDIAVLIRQYSQKVSADLKQLLGQMWFNHLINNRDDHLRNFSFLAGPTKLGLSPAYDLVPSDTLGAYPQLSFKQRQQLPSLEGWQSNERDLKAVFQLSRLEVAEIQQRLAAAFEQWPVVFAEAGVLERDMRLMQRLIVWR